MYINTVFLDSRFESLLFLASFFFFFCKLSIDGDLRREARGEREEGETNFE